MSGLALIWNRDGAPARAEEVAPLLTRLRHRGPDGADVYANDTLALGHAHFWTTPEEVGERQPLVHHASGCALVFDGRLDNREDLLPVLATGKHARASLSDAALVLRAYLRWGDDCAQHFLGPFALVVYDPRRRGVFCARDAVGERTLFYHLTTRRFLAASEEYPLTAVPDVGSSLDDTTLARFFAVRGPRPGDSFHAGIRELQPGHAMYIGRGRVQHRLFYAPSPLDPPVNDGDAAEALREILTQSVRARLRAPAPAAIMMSGGLDSTSVAALASKSRDSPIHSFSYVFEHFAACDEHLYINAMADAGIVEPHYIPGDDAWPLRHANALPHNPNSPSETSYRRLMDSVYNAAATVGTNVLLTGNYGDHLYAGASLWFVDFLRTGRWVDAGAELVRAVYRHGPAAACAGGWPRHLVGAALDALPVARRLRPRRIAGAPSWLTPHARHLLEAADPPSTRPGWTAAGERLDTILGPMPAHRITTELTYAARCNVELRHPYRDRRVIEFMLSVPSYLLHRPTSYKQILARSMRGLLPEGVRTRQRPTSLLPFFVAGLAERERSTAEALIASPDALWRRYVREDWMTGWRSHLRTGPDGPQLIVVWNAIFAELWRTRIESSVLPDRHEQRREEY